MFSSYRVTGENKLTSGIIHSSIFMAGWTFAIYIAWALMQVTIVTVNDEKSLLELV